MNTCILSVCTFKGIFTYTGIFATGKQILANPNFSLLTNEDVCLLGGQQSLQKYELQSYTFLLIYLLIRVPMCFRNNVDPHSTIKSRKWVAITL